MVYGLAIARDLGLLDGYTAYYFGNMEECCDGMAPNTFVEADPKVKPDFVIIGEPTKMQVYRGHKGRIELKITATGRSAHAASHYLGDNAVYKMMAIITQIRELDRRMRFGMGDHPVAKFYPPCLLDDAHPLARAGQGTIEALWGEKRTLGTWDFSTNGTYWAGKAGIPSIGFGPGDEKFAHTSLEQVPLDEVVAATEFYALFPSELRKKVDKDNGKT